MLKTKKKYVPETKTVYGQDGPAEGLADEMTDVVVYIKKNCTDVRLYGQPLNGLISWNRAANRT